MAELIPWPKPIKVSVKITMHVTESEPQLEFYRVVLAHNEGEWPETVSGRDNLEFLLTGIRMAWSPLGILLDVKIPEKPESPRYVPEDKIGD